MTTSEIAQMARAMYGNGPIVRRTMQHLRPYNCPLDVLVSLAPDAGSIFDIGCGCGIFLGLAVKSGKAITGLGVDTSEASLRVAREMSAALGGRLRFERVRGVEDWPDERFDLVSMIDVMHHIPPDRQAAVFEAAASRVKAGGALLYKDMVRRPRWRAWANRLHDLAVAREWIHYYPVEQADAAARDLGLIPVRAETLNRLWYGHELRVWRRAK
jgi:2-polyprenyl-3-methyl-5-hydroxy-6-metoxy-1,4-benzoquinol methylase